FSSRRRHTRFSRDWSSDVCSSDLSLVVDAQFGKHNRGGAFNKNHLDQGMYFNLGVPIEKNLSEYFRVFIRPAYEFSSYTINLPRSEERRVGKESRFPEWMYQYRSM